MEDLEHFNTSHVTVYPVKEQKKEETNGFQYISCYCLSYRLCRIPCHFRISIHLMLLFIILFIYCIPLSFLISIHLMLLFITEESYFPNMGYRFQYISCYCLSTASIMLLVCDTWFQYISCYCLSLTISGSLCSFCHFNTSHVTVYHSPPLPVLHSLFHFNTSHVTVYLVEKQRRFP